MVFPLIPAAIVAGGIGAGAGYSIFKKEKAPSQNVTHAPYETYAPQKTMSYAPVSSIQYPSYQIQIDSPASYQSMKKTADIESAPHVAPTQSVAPISGAMSDSGIDIMPIAIIAGVALIGMKYLESRK